MVCRTVVGCVTTPSANKQCGGQGADTMRHMTVRVAWVCWGIDLLAVLYACGLVVSDPHRDSMQSVAYFLLVVLLVLLAGSGGLLYCLARGRSSILVYILGCILS